MAGGKHGKKKSKESKKRAKGKPSDDRASSLLDALAREQEHERAHEAPPAPMPPSTTLLAGDGKHPSSFAASPRARGRLTEMVPVRFDAQTLSAVKERAAADHRSVSSFIRRAVELELERPPARP
jgi:hypothetical protein